MYFYLPNITDPTYNQQLKEVFIPPNQIAVGIRKQITILILH
jgi:hypothetical protein